MKLAHVALASVGLIGMSYAVAQLQSASPCPGSPCNAVIVLRGGCGDGVVVAPDPIRVTSGKATTITWKIVSPNWEFASNGIEIQLSPKAITPAGAKAASGTTYSVVFDPGGPKVAYKYDVNLVNTATKTACKADPTIANY